MVLFWVGAGKLKKHFWGWPSLWRSGPSAKSRSLWLLRDESKDLEGSFSPILLWFWGAELLTYVLCPRVGVGTGDLCSNLASLG